MSSVNIQKLRLGFCGRGGVKDFLVQLYLYKIQTMSHRFLKKKQQQHIFHETSCFIFRLVIFPPLLIVMRVDTHFEPVVSYT